MLVVRINSKFNSILMFLCLQQFVSTSRSPLRPAEVATELRIHNFTVFRTVLIFVLYSQQLLTLKRH